MKGRVARGVGGSECDADAGGGSDGRAGDEEAAWNDSGGGTGEEPFGQIPLDGSEEAEQKRADAEGDKGKS